MKYAFSILLFASAAGLSGCFNNLAEDEGSGTKSAQGFVDRGATVIGGGIELEADLVSAYREMPSGIGLVLSIDKPLTAAIGATGLAELLDHPSDSDLIRIDVSPYHFSLSVPATRLVAAGRLLNVIRVTASRIDFMSGQIQDSAPAIRVATNQSPVVLFGGKIEGGVVDQMSLAFFDPLSRASGFLPNFANTGFGVNFPVAPPAGIVPELVPITDALGGIFARVFRNPDHTLRSGVPANFSNLSFYPEQYFMAIYRNGSGAIVEAKAVYLSSVPSAAQDSFTFCATRFDDFDDYIFAVNGNGDQIQGGYPQSCQCAEPLYSTSDTFAVPTSLLSTDPCSASNRKIPALSAAISANPAPSRTGTLFATSTTVSGIGVSFRP